MLENALSQNIIPQIWGPQKYIEGKKKYHLEETGKLTASNAKLPKDKIMYENTERSLYFLCHFCFWRLKVKDFKIVSWISSLAWCMSWILPGRILLCSALSSLGKAWDILKRQQSLTRNRLNYNVWTHTRNAFQVVCQSNLITESMF